MGKLPSKAELLTSVELMALDAGQDPDQALAAFKYNFGPFFDNYKIDGRITEKKTAIGEPLKKIASTAFAITLVHPPRMTPLKSW